GDLTELNLYVDGEFNGSASAAGLGDITNDDDLFFGRGRSDLFRGQVDEVRIWSTARTDVQINSSMALQPDGDEPGLVGYWPFDEGEGSAVTDFTGTAQYGVLSEGVYWTDDAAPIDISADTDIEGNYIHTGLKFEDGDTLYVRPSEGERQFQPAFKTVVLSEQSPVVNEISFVEISSYTVSGQIMFAGTDCPASDVMILLDGSPTGVTDKNGIYAVSAGNGEHTVSASLDGHTFLPADTLLIVDSNMSADFTNTTLHTLSGSVGGGCGRYVGDVTITFESRTGCMVEALAADSATASYSISLPPQVYHVSADVEPSSIPVELNDQDVIDFFDDLGVREIDLTAVTDTMLDFIYRAPLVVTIEGLADYVPVCPQLSVDGDTLPSGLPVIEQFEYVTLQVKVNEDYGSGGICPLDTGTVTIYDEIFDRSDTPVTLPVSEGVAEYTTFASTPSLISGRMVEGVNRSYQKSITAHASAVGQSADPVSEWVLVTGHVAQEGFEFVTFTGSVQPEYILRDPPGDNSYSYLEEGYTSCANLQLGGSFTTGGGLQLDIEWGLERAFFIGLGAGTIEEIEIQQEDKFKATRSTTSKSDYRTETCLSFNDRFSTSSNDLFTGERGDVFIGAGTNYIFAEVNVIEIEGCEVVRSTSIGVQPEGFHTTFAYTKQHIEDTLIPELEDRVAYYLGIEEADSAEIYQDALDDWQRMLDMNDELKLVSQLSENRSFSAGAEYEYTHTSETTQSFSASLTLRAGLEYEHGTRIKLFGNNFKLTASVFMNAEVSAGVGGVGTTTETVGYSLNDDDIGDNFTVDVKADNTYPSPVFDVLAGVSSCPWEAWPDTSGMARMTPRDGAALLVDPVTAVNVPADEAAIFNFTLVNESGSEEARWYTMRLLAGSNPDGAVVLVNGSAFITEGLDFFLEPYEAQQVTMTVLRGPEKYSYDSLKVMLYPPCEYAIWERHGGLQLADVMTFNVHFDPPCSEIALNGPADGWMYDKTMQTAGDSMLVMLAGYDRDLGAPGEGLNIDYAGAQYRRLGSGDEGPDEWAVCGAVIMYADLPEDNVTIKWLLPESLEDGAYELRAFTHCADGEGYSETVVGTIDRHSPVVFGTPEPSDGILSFGEDISITFNERLDSLSIDEGDITLKYLDGPLADSLIAQMAVCNGSRIIITPTADTGDLEGRRIEAGVGGITDRIGNPLETAAVWEFDYRRSQFAWSDADIVMEGALGNPGKLMAELVNGTGESVDFSFTGMPTWITGAIPSTGTILPGETQLVELLIQTDIAEGSYHDEVRAEATDGSNVSVAVLTVDLTIGCQAPAWAVNPNGFEHSMVVVAKLDIAGVKSTDRADMVGAYVGGELRGVASIDSVHVYDIDTGYDYSWLAFLTVYSNRPSGETVRFAVWDGSECRLYGATEETHPFVADGQAGTPDTPVTLTATDVIGGDVLAIEVQEGWNWISTNIWTADMSVTNILADLNLASGDLIKSQTAFSQFIDDSDPDIDPTWVPAFDLDNVSGYLVNLAQAGTIIHTGSPVSVDSIITVAQGWNWIGYLPAGAMAVDIALDDLDVGGQNLLIDNDIIKGQDGFSQYLGGDWYGTLTEMDPGRGYKLYLANAGVTGFNYPVYVGSPAEPPVAVADTEVPESEATVEGEQAVNAPDWAVNPYAYQFNMTMTAVLRVDGLESADGRDVIGAFVDGECRGVASPEYIGGIRRYEAFLMIHSNEAAGESVTFRVFDADEGTICGVTEKVDWQPDAVVGTVTQPFVLSAVSGEEEEDGGVPKAFALMQNVPNPFNPSTTIYYDVPSGGGNVSLRVYDVSGRLVRTLVNGHEAEGSRSVTWDGMGDRGQSIASGIYFYRMTAQGFAETKKMVLLR
ncbi:MAG: T9SS type A sorting domain-containing protein, partial [Candidatus Krumholzibacteria bacterium]|nr:T9SS type A sorting domain-containing protein [Candidatus Krumholzibacteria bacterium]